MIATEKCRFSAVFIAHFAVNFIICLSIGHMCVAATAGFAGFD
ncbi:hypothetical protein BN1012_Phect550 [Candidatus Phaeomarinobacter ectocarpi]|uniref:Uncharacterized protein n=1 Tax=Candidatus Phaeomarinibacter ectocarpi TaxID=1458461 RepID=X5MDU1_9HYPH|nr:hypothetical protein BN1012_Phect550 [Candidatus Phaeomarinobacter ectocarpi]